jgi:hypothetical protein
MWHYLFFKAYLKSIHPNDYNGNASYISRKIANNDVTWFPIKRYEGVQDILFLDLS